MEKNRSYGPAVRAGGANYIHTAGDNGFGLNSDAPFSKGTGTYDPQAQSGAPINGDGKDNFGNGRRGDGVGGQERAGLSAPGTKDSIETMGQSAESAARSM